MQVGLVFQFPERHFLGRDILSELTFAWPQGMEYWADRQRLSMRMQQVCVGQILYFNCVSDLYCCKKVHQAVS